MGLNIPLTPELPNIPQASLGLCNLALVIVTIVTFVGKIEIQFVCQILRWA